jgi:hypothetical protein
MKFHNSLEGADGCHDACVCVAALLHSALHDGGVAQHHEQGTCVFEAESPVSKAAKMQRAGAGFCMEDTHKCLKQTAVGMLRNTPTCVRQTYRQS